MPEEQSPRMKRLMSLLHQHKACELEIGRVCYELITLESVPVAQLANICKKFDISNSKFTVLLRNAKGDYGKWGDVIATNGKHSETALMPTEVAVNICENKQTYYSKAEGRKKESTFPEAHPIDQKQCFDRNGAKPLLELPSVVSCPNAYRIVQDSNKNTIIFLGHGEAPLKMRVSRKLLEDALAMVDNVEVVLSLQQVS